MCQSSHSLSFSLSQSLWFFIFNFASLFLYSFTRTSSVVISFSYRCLPYSISNPNLLSSAQLLFTVTNLFSTRTWSTRLFWEFISYGWSKLIPIRLPYDDLMQLVPGRQDLQFFRVYYSTSLLYSSYKPPSRSDVILLDFVPGILASTAEPLASILHLATAEYLISLPLRNLVTEHLATVCDDLGCLESAGTHGIFAWAWEDQFS